jgi:hypothetical protein
MTKLEKLDKLGMITPAAAAAKAHDSNSVIMDHFLCSLLSMNCDDHTRPPKFATMHTQQKLGPSVETFKPTQRRTQPREIRLP